MTALRIDGLAWTLATLLLACSSGTTHGDADRPGIAGNAGAGAQSNEDAGASGAHAGAGHAGNHSAGSGGNASTAGSGGNATGGSGAAGFPGCHTSVDCPKVMTVPTPGISLCLAPGQAEPARSCGAPQWCGECNCSSQPSVPSGDGMSCQTNADCPQPNGTANSLTARVCDSGRCTACAQNSDCPSTSPVCETAALRTGLSYRVCTVCEADTDCPSDRPHCYGNNGVAACGECRTTADCARGVCNSGACTPQCTTNASCGEAMECTAEQRCQALSCQSDADCPINRACTNGHCSRRGCTTDAMCQGACVNGGCYESLGRCYVQLQPA